MKLLRHIHPIGQGAFYTEQFLDKENKLIASTVYDCGSCSKNNKLPEFGKKYISNYSKSVESIDILFISHFHADHINGIEHLKESEIKNVIIPKIDNIAKLLYLCECDFDKDIKEIILNPEKYFKDSNIIKVNTVEVSNIESNNDNIINLNEDNTPKEIDSYTKISIPGMTATPWIYIPINYDYKHDVSCISAELAKLGILSSTDLNELFKIDKSIINKIKKIFKSLYKNNDSINGNSMMVYSGLLDERKYLKLINTNRTICYRPICFKPLCFNPMNNRSGCLYTGDISLKSDNAINCITKRLRPYTDNISTIQIPHHGSKENFSEDIYAINSNYLPFFISCGIDNKYGHPAAEIITSLHLKRKCYTCITEDPNSSLIYEYNFEINTK